VVAKLIESAAAKRREIAITKEEFLIGRGPDCDLRLGSSAVSRHHCLMRVRGQEVTVTDLGSSNGTFLNGKRVRSSAPLHSGDELRCGSFTFVLQLADDEGIAWGTEPDVDPNANTAKLKDAKRGAAADQDIARPPGEASGPGGA
jgi:pSer/pThr/pTyr-binding forkhead associated (FHA) protein